jgi:hypothetical protein
MQEGTEEWGTGFRGPERGRYHGEGRSWRLERREREVVACVEVGGGRRWKWRELDDEVSAGSVLSRSRVVVDGGGL